MSGENVRCDGNDPKVDLEDAMRFLRETLSEDGHLIVPSDDASCVRLAADTIHSLRRENEDYEFRSSRAKRKKGRRT